MQFVEVARDQRRLGIVPGPTADAVASTLRNFGLKVGIAGAMKFEARIEELVEHAPDLAVLVEPLLVVRGCYASKSLFCIAAC